MAIDLTVIGVGVDTSKVKQGSKDLDAFGRSANTAAGKADQSTQSMGAMASIAGKLAIVLGATGLAKSLITVIDANTKYTAQLKLATQSQEQFNLALADVQRIARTAQSDIASVATLYARLNSSLRDVGVTQQEVARITENVGLALKISGATANESSSAILQLSQAFASGVLRGEEFNAVSESAPALMRALAESIGVPIGQLRAMAAEGQITGEVLNRAFGDEKLLEKFRQQAKEVNTISGAFTVLKGEFTGAMAEFVKGTGIVDLVTGSINLLSTALAGLRDTLKGVNIKGFFADLVPGFNLFKDFAGLVNSLRPDAPQPRRAGSIGGVGAISPVGNIAPNFNVTPPVADVREVHKLQQEQLERQRELNVLRDAAMAKQNAEEVRRINVGIFVNEELYKQEKARIDAAQVLQTQVDKENAEASKRMLEIKQKAANENYDSAIKQAKEEADKYNRIFERANDNLSRSLTDSIVRGFERGEKFITTFKNAITTAFRGYFVNIGVNFAQEALSGTIGKIGKSVLGAIGLGGSSMAVAGDGVATAGLLDSAKGVFDVITKGFDSANAALQGSVEAFGSFLTNGQGGIFDAIGGAIGQYSSVISGALPYAGAALALLKGDTKGALFQGGGAALGSLVGGPVGGAIGAALGSVLGGAFGGKKQPARTVTDLSGVAGAFSESMSTLLKGFGFAGNVSANAEYRGRGGGSGYGTLNSNVDGLGRHRSIQYKGAYGDATMQQFINTALTSYLVDSINQTALPAGIKALFAGLTDRTQISNMIQAAVALSQSQSTLANKYNITVENAALLAKETGLVGDEFLAFVNKLVSTATSLNTPAQALIQLRDGLSSRIGSLPATVEQFDAIAKSIDKTNQSGRALFTTFLTVRDSFIQFTQALDSIKKGVSDTVYGLLSPTEQLAINQQRLNEEFAKFGIAIPASVEQFIAIGRSINYTTEAGLNLAMAFPSLVSSFQAVTAQSEELRLSLAKLDLNRFSTFTDFAIAQSYSNAGLAIPAANMPSYAVGTSYVPNDGVAMLHQGEAVLTKSQNTDMTMNSGKVVVLLESIANRVGALEVDMRRTADGTQRTAKELEDLTGGDVSIRTQAA